MAKACAQRIWPWPGMVYARRARRSRGRAVKTLPCVAEFVDGIADQLGVLAVHVPDAVGEFVEEADLVDAHADQVRGVVVQADDPGIGILDERPAGLRIAAKVGQRAAARPAFDGDGAADLLGGLRDGPTGSPPPGHKLPTASARHQSQ